MGVGWFVKRLGLAPKPGCGNVCVCVCAGAVSGDAECISILQGHTQDIKRLAFHPTLQASACALVLVP